MGIDTWTKGAKMKTKRKAGRPRKVRNEKVQGVTVNMTVPQRKMLQSIADARGESLSSTVRLLLFDAAVAAQNLAVFEDDA